MATNTRRFLRESTTTNARALKDESVRISDRERVFLSSAAGSRKSLLGAAKGRLVIRGDLTQPTLPAKGWRPSL